MAHSRDLIQAADQVREKAVRLTTWHGLSLQVARLVLLGFATLWFRSYWFDINPQIVGVSAAGGYYIDPATVLNGLLDLLLVVVLAVSTSTVPSIFLAGLIPNSPAGTLLSGLEFKYGKPGYYFAVIGATVFSTLGALTLYDFWSQRENVVALGQAAILTRTAASLVLMVGFPAWALNRMTPEQWIDAILQAREVARIKRIIDLEDMAEKAMIARARALLYADVTKMTLAERAQNSKEVAAILAAAQRGMTVALRQVGMTFKSLHGMELLTQVEPDDAINRRYKYLADTLTTAADETEWYADRVQVFANAIASERPGDQASDRVSDRSLEVAPAAPVALPDAETGDWASDRARSEVGRHGTAAALGDKEAGAIAVARRELSGAWTREELQTALSVRKTQALDYIKRWSEAGIVTRLTEPKDHYAFAEVA